jgi:NAD-dependent DNA ligase
MKSLVTDNGGSIATTVTNSVDYLVANDSSTSKYAAAEKKGKPIVTEEWLVQSVDNGSLSTGIPTLYQSIDTHCI